MCIVTAQDRPPGETIKSNLPDLKLKIIRFRDPAPVFGKVRCVNKSRFKRNYVCLYLIY